VGAGVSVRVFDPARHCGYIRRSDDIKPSSSGSKGHKGDPCRYPKGWGTDHKGSGPCRLHLGNSDQGKATAANERAAALLKGLGQPVAIDPQRALLSVVAWSYGRLQAIVEQIGDALQAERPDAQLVTALKDEFGEALDRVTRTSKVTIDADIAERQLKLEEADGQRISALLIGALDQYEKTSKPNPLARKAATTWLIAEMRRIDDTQPMFQPGWVH
jgi:hypothetical protein